MQPFEVYRIGCDPRDTEKVELPVPDWSKLRSPDGYLADQSMADAVNVAIALGQPLLVTGEAGTGKTMLAYSIAHQLGLDEPLKFETKSTSESRDLFYTYNALARFQAAHTGEKNATTLDYIDFSALGLAIIRANAADTYADLRSRDKRTSVSCRSVVLIDEVDKAPRDFPNDILNAVEHLSFSIPELGNVVVSAARKFLPIVVLTSNSEKNLPDAFLRRCVFYHIPPPSRGRLEEIVTRRLGDLSIASKFLSMSLDLFEFLRNPDIALVKKPATAELLGWLIALRCLFPDDVNPLERSLDDVARSMGALLKTVDDQKQCGRLLQRWKASNGAPTTNV